MSTARIRLRFANGTTAERLLQPGTYGIGREAGDIVLGDPNVSGRHAELRVGQADVLVADLGSTNGTYDMAGNRIVAPLALKPNQWVRMGECSLMLLEPLAAPGGTRVMPQVPAAGFGAVSPAQVPGPAPGYAAVPPPSPAVPAPGYAPVPPPGAAAPHPGYAAVPSPAIPAPGHAPVPPPGAAAAPPGYAAVPSPAIPAPGYAAVPPPSPGPSVQVIAPFSALEGPLPVSEHSHPDDPVRHSYPVTQQTFGFGAAAGLLMKTAPFVVARLAILGAMSLVGLVYWVVAIGGFVLLGVKSPIVGWAWLVAMLVAAGWFWRAVVRYFLYLLKAAHIAVLTELITKGSIGNGGEGMFAYGKRVVTERFGEVSALFAVDLLVDGIVRAFNRTLDWVSNLLPVPGLHSVMGVVKAVLRASTTYIDETVFSYNLARGDSNVFRSSKDGLIYYAQNSKEILKTGVYVVVLEKVLSFVVFWVVFLPVLAAVYVLPSTFGAWIPITALVGGFLFAGAVQQAVLKPLFLTMLLLRFHSLVRGQPINLEWDRRLESATTKFRELKDKAARWVDGRSAPAPAPYPSPAE
jgi:hypothetical protein